MHTAATFSYLFTCPAGHPKHAQRQAFNTQSSKQMVWCGTCKTSHHIKRIHCLCKVSWTVCPLHFKDYPDARAKRQSVQQPRVHITCMSNSLLLQLGGQAARPIKLGPRLAERFPHIADTYHTRCLPRVSSSRESSSHT